MPRPTTIERQFKEVEIREKEERVKIDTEKVKISKLEVLRDLLRTEKPIDGNAVGEYNKYELLFDESERESLKVKIFQIVHTL
jgi:hypothetical protein